MIDWRVPIAASERHDCELAPAVDLLDVRIEHRCGKLDLFTTAYTVWIAYHAILQDRQKPKELEQLEEQERERILDQERQTVARIQIRQALREMELRLKLQSQAVEG
jgi:hypothetical protein